MGDIFDAIRSTKWLNGDVRPWSSPRRQPFIDKLSEITTSIAQNNSSSLEVLRGFSGDRPVTIPPATRSGRPRQVSHNQDAKSRQPVPVNIHYMIGNHDWFYHLPDVSHNPIRQIIADAMGLATPPDQPFPHEPAESDALQALLEPYQLFARHGDIFDPFNFEGDRDAATLGDAVVVELLNRFPTEVTNQMGNDLPTACLDGLKEIDNVRPVLLVPVWINSLLNRTVPEKAKRDKVKDIWDDLADDFLNHPFVRARDKAHDFFDTVDKLEWALKFSKGLSLQTMSQVVTWVKQKITSGVFTTYDNAFEEEAFQKKKARFIIHGHTHHREIVPLDSAIIGGRRLDQMYFNSGTWRRIHEMARYRPTDQEFMGFHEMTYFAFFKDDERGGRPFEVWTGNLGAD
jgi:UDP-2,3-diacylglucosamine pyrophosphatase LpxH